MTARRTRRGWGKVRALPSGRLQASYVGPDNSRHVAPLTFDARIDAEAWLARERRSIDLDTWSAPGAREVAEVMTLETYAAAWLAHRRLKPGTRHLYSRLLAVHILPAFGAEAVESVTPAQVRAWYATLAPDAPTARAHAYSLLRTVYTTATDDGLVSANPCRVRGAGSTKRARDVEPATPAQVEALATAMPERLALLVPLAAWCALRRGEVLELRRSDFEPGLSRVRVERAVTMVGGTTVQGTTKTGRTRAVTIPPHLIPVIEGHLAEFVDPEPDAFLFTGVEGNRLHPEVFRRAWEHARAEVGMDAFRFHDLRHTGATMATQAGATLREVMDRLGHSTPAAALKYQHVADARAEAIAVALSDMAADPGSPRLRVVRERSA